MKNKRHWVLIITLILVLFAAFFILKKVDTDSDKPKLSSQEKSWIMSQRGSKIPLLIPGNDSPYFYETSEGEFGGVYQDYLKTLEKDYGLQFQVIKKNSAQFTQEVDRGEVVAIFNATKNPSREKNYNFFNLNSETSIVLVKKFEKEFPKDDTSLKKLGVIKNTTEDKNYFMYFPPYKYTKIFLSDFNEGIEKLKKGEIDLLLGKSKDFIVVDTEISVMEKIVDMNNSLAINRKYPELYSIFEKTLPVFEEKQFSQSFANQRNLFIAQKLKDTTLLKEVKERYSKIVVELPDSDDLLPLYYFKDGKFQGYLSIILKDMSLITGIPIEIARSSSPEKKHIRAIDFSSGSDLSIPYYKSELAVAGKRGSRYIKSFDDLKNNSVGVVLNNSTKNISVREQLDFIPFSETGDALLALKKGEVDYVVGDFVFLDSKIENMHLGNDLKFLGILGNFQHNLAFTFQEEDRILYNLFSLLFPKDISEFSTFRDLLISPQIINFNYYYLGMGALFLLGIFGVVLLFLKNNINHRKKAENLNNAMISSLEMAAAFSDEDTGQHIIRVTKYSELLAKEMRLSSGIVRDIGLYASLHDIGKIGIPNSILRKPGKLDPEEMAEMRKHPDIGYRLVKNAGLGKTAENLVRFHHERWDGKGYPVGLREKSIPIEARVVAIADVYDALRQKRSYKHSYSHDEAVQIIVSESGVFFDPKVVDVFLKLSSKFDEIFSKH